MVKALKYRIRVADSFLDWSQGVTYMIGEIFIPEKEIAFNIVRDRLNVFQCKKTRETENLEEIELDNDFVENLERLIELRETLFEVAKKYFSDELQ